MLAHLIPWTGYYQPTTQVPVVALGVADWLTRIFQGGGETHPAVLGFIVLSGYCIHRTGFGRDVPLVAFAVRRSFRILPVYLLAIAAGVLAYITSTTLLDDPLRPVGGTTAILAECVAAKAVALPTVYPSLHVCAFLGNAPLNTVMAEIALYVAYPILWLGFRKVGGPALMWTVILSIWLAGVATISRWPDLVHWWSSASLPGFLLYWWIGATALSRGFGGLLHRNWPMFLLGWLSLSVAILILGVDLAAIDELRKVFFALLVAALIKRLDRPAKSRGPLSFVGEAGYSIYAFHAPILYTLLIVDAPWWSAGIAAIAVGLASFFIVEKPSMRLGAHFLVAHHATRKIT